MAIECKDKKTGVYSILGTTSLSYNNPNLDYRARVEIRINGTLLSLSIMISLVRSKFR